MDAAPILDMSVARTTQALRHSPSVLAQLDCSCQSWTYSPACDYQTASLRLREQDRIGLVPLTICDAAACPEFRLQRMLEACLK